MCGACKFYTGERAKPSTVEAELESLVIRSDAKGEKRIQKI
jgi:hypothetical protein